MVRLGRDSPSPPDLVLLLFLDVRIQCSVQGQEQRFLLRARTKKNLLTCPKFVLQNLEIHISTLVCMSKRHSQKGSGEEGCALKVSAATTEKNWLQIGLGKTFE